MSCILGNVGTCFVDLREKNKHFSYVIAQNWCIQQKLSYNKCPYLWLNIAPDTLHPPSPAWTNADFQGLSLHHLVLCWCAAEPRLKVSEGEGALNLTATGLISAPLPRCSPSPSLTHQATNITHTHARTSSGVSSCSPPLQITWTA